MKATLVASAIWMTVLSVTALVAGTPKLQFEQTVYDFGKTSQVENVSGTFKYKNVGDAVLKLEAPKPSCGCTIAGLKPDTLNPGETGELAFTFNLGRSRVVMEKRIAVKSNRVPKRTPPPRASGSLFNGMVRRGVSMNTSMFSRPSNRTFQFQASLFTARSGARFP